MFPTTAAWCSSSSLSASLTSLSRICSRSKAVLRDGARVFLNQGNSFRRDEMLNFYLELGRYVSE